MKTKRKNLKGFTLLEVLVALAISSMLLSGALALLLPSNKMYDDSVKLQQEREISAMVTKGINERVRFAKDILVLENVSGYPSCTSMTYNDYHVIRISRDDYTFQGKTVKGRVFLKEKLSGGTEKKMIPDDISGKFSYELKVVGSGYDINTEIDIYRIDYKGNKADKLKSTNTVRLKNYELALKAITYYDGGAVPLPAPIPGLGIVSGHDTIILYK